MPRHRLRDWPMRVYWYWTRPRAPLPESLWIVAKAMRDAWNALCVGRDRAASEARMLAACYCGDDHREQIKARWSRWNEEARAIVSGPGLNWETGPAVLDRFTTACVAALRHQRGWPRPHGGLDRLAIPHRFTGGGVSVSTLGSKRTKRARLIFPPDSAYRTQTGADRRRRMSPMHREGPHPADEWNLFQVGAQYLRFRAIFHRRLPIAAIVKQITWLGRRHVTRGWQWAIAITVEEPPKPGVVRAERCAGLDLGWRLMRPTDDPHQDYLRIGVLVDGPTGAAIELRLPLAAPTAHTRRHRLRANWRDLAGMDQAIGVLLDATKATLPPTTPHLSQMRQGGLIRLLRAVTVSGDAPATLATLTAWREQNDRLRAMRMELWDRLIGRRRWLYENLAAWIMSTWTHVAWEGDLGLKGMAEKVDKTPAIDASMRYRQIASLHLLRLALKQAAAKRGTVMIDKPAAYTTLTCADCGAILTVQDGSLCLECPQGHRWDQDVNAARGLVSQIGQRQDHGNDLRNSVKSSEAESLVIPDRLRAVAVHVHAG